jgi:hypothetical protein
MLQATVAKSLLADYEDTLLDSKFIKITVFTVAIPHALL